jgi:hypothetical protein
LQQKEKIMKSIKTLTVAALAAGGLMATVDVAAQEKHGFRGGHRHHGHGHGHFHRHRHHFGPHFGLAIGLPLAWGWGWGPGFYGDPWFYGPQVIYREREVIREVEPAPETTQVPRGAGAPTQGPMYMNYCESAKAYYPKVTQCPEGWKLTTPTQ